MQVMDGMQVMFASASITVSAEDCHCDSPLRLGQRWRACRHTDTSGQVLIFGAIDVRILLYQHALCIVTGILRHWLSCHVTLYIE